MHLKNKSKSSIASLAFLVAAATLASSIGCASSTRTRVDPATTEATHDTRVERAGRSKERTVELIIEPRLAPAEVPTQAPKKSSTRESSMVQPVGSLVALPSHLADATGATRATIQPVGWSPKRANDDVDPAIGEAIREASRNGNTVRFKVTETEEIPLAADVSNSTLHDSGAGLDTRSDEAALGFDGSKGGAGLPWGSKSGKTKWGLDASLFSKGVNPMHIIGAIVMLAAIIPVLVPPRRWVTAGLVAGVGLMIIAAGTVSEEAPWVFVLAILGFLGVAGWLGYEAWRNKRRGIALESVVRGVENHPGSAVKEEIKNAAGANLETVKSEITAMKKKAKVSITT